MTKLGWAALGAAAATVAAFFGATAYSGHQMQTAMLAQPRQWARALPFVEVHELQYEKRFAGATRTTTLKLGCPGTPPLLLTWRDTISHGPLVGGTTLAAAVIDSELVLGPKAPPVTARTVVDFAGGTKTELAVARFDAELPQGRVAWQGVKLSWQVPADAPGSYTLEVPAFELHDTQNGASLKLAGFHARGQGVPGVSWITASSGSAELASLDLRVQPRGQSPVEAGLRQVKLTTGANVDASGLLHATGSLAGEAQIGSAKLDRFDMQASVKRLHAPSYEALMAGMTAASCDPHALQRDPVALQAALLQLLPHNPEFALDKLTVSHAGRQAVLSYAAGVDGVTAAELTGALAPVLLAKATLRLDLQVPAAWVGQAAQLEQALQQGWLQRDGETLSASLRFAQGALSVNGRAMPLPTTR